LGSSPPPPSWSSSSFSRRPSARPPKSSLSGRAAPRPVCLVCHLYIHIHLLLSFSSVNCTLYIHPFHFPTFTVSLARFSACISFSFLHIYLCSISPHLSLFHFPTFISVPFTQRLSLFHFPTSTLSLFHLSTSAVSLVHFPTSTLYSISGPFFPTFTVSLVYFPTSISGPFPHIYLCSIFPRLSLVHLPTSISGPSTSTVF
jgi:hypothetical protein